MYSQNNHTSKLLVSELQKGNPKSFRRLFDLYWEQMFVKAKAMIDDENAAKDIVQEVWVKLWQQRRTNEIRNFEAYIFRAVRNGCYKYYRDKKFNLIQLGIIENLPLASEPEIIKAHNLEDFQSRLRLSLNSLPKRCREIFELSRLKQYSNEEIASELGISKRSVENQISLAIKSLKHSLTVILLFFIS